jgi:hypothetical protein
MDCSCELLGEVDLDLVSGEASIIKCRACGGTVSIERIYEQCQEPTVWDRVDNLAKAYRELGRAVMKAIRGPF